MALKELVFFILLPAFIYADYTTHLFNDAKQSLHSISHMSKSFRFNKPSRYEVQIEYAPEIASSTSYSGLLQAIPDVVIPSSVIPAFLSLRFLIPTFSSLQKVIPLNCNPCIF